MSKSPNINLDRVALVAQQLNLLPLNLPVVTIAGTNGKGSCVKYLESILLAEGYSVGAFTSPHLLRYNERIRIDGEEIDDESLNIALLAVSGARGEIELGYFDYATLAALYIFRHIDLDIVLLEVGIGGRLDPVNIVNPSIAVITTIAMDHMDRLGNSRAKIGVEKAGILRANTPFVCGDAHPPVEVVDNAQQLNASSYYFSKDFSYRCVDDDRWHWFSGNKKIEHLPLVKLPMQNAATALMVIELLQKDLPVSRRAIDVGLATAFLYGRMQVFAENPLVILDVAHNPESANYLAKQLVARRRNGKVLAVFAMLKDKDILATIRPMLELVDCWYVSDLAVCRGESSKKLQNYLQDLKGTSRNKKFCFKTRRTVFEKRSVLGVHEHSRKQCNEVLDKRAISRGSLKISACYTHQSVVAAYMHALKDSSQQDVIVVFGSFYTVAEILSSGVNDGYEA